MPILHYKFDFKLLRIKNFLAYLVTQPLERSIAKTANVAHVLMLALKTLSPGFMQSVPRPHLACGFDPITTVTFNLR